MGTIRQQRQAVQRTAHQLTPAVNPTYTGRRLVAKLRSRAERRPSRRIATGVRQRSRAASCMRLLGVSLAAPARGIGLPYEKIGCRDVKLLSVEVWADPSQPLPAFWV